MADTQETVADIAAEKRRIAKEVRDYASNGDYWDKKEANEIAEELEEEADRLEAAHRRERGNAAKLREALDESRRIASDLGGCRLNDYWKLNEIVRVCEAALAAPPRNCDVYSSDELRVIFNSELASELPIANEHEKKLVAITAMGVIDTLFAPATEKEGGAK